MYQNESRDILSCRWRHIWAIWLKMCLFVIRDAKNMFQENRGSNVRYSSPHSRIACCAIHSGTTLCSDMRQTVSLCLWGFDCWIQQCWTEYLSSMCSFTLKQMCTVFDAAQRGACIYCACIYVCIYVHILNAETSYFSFSLNFVSPKPLFKVATDYFYVLN